MFFPYGGYGYGIGRLYFDWTYLLILPALLFSLWAQFAVQSRYRKYAKVPSRHGYTGAQIAVHLLAQAGLSQIQVTPTAGELTDHYDPKSGQVRLTDGVGQSSSVAALGITAHEIGHAMQDAENYGPLKLRNVLVPVANFGSRAAVPLFIAGLIFSWSFLMDIGILFFGVSVVFYLVTLPVEFNASHRALASLEQGGYLERDEIPAARSVLWAAAMTYVAGALMAILQLLRLILLRRRRD